MTSPVSNLGKTRVFKSTLDFAKRYGLSRPATLKPNGGRK